MKRSQKPRGKRSLQIVNEHFFIKIKQQQGNIIMRELNSSTTYILLTETEWDISELQNETATISLETLSEHLQSQLIPHKI